MKLSTILSFMPGGTDVCAMPSWSNPRLLFSDGTVSDRWSRSELYPAFRLRGRIYRTALRSRVALLPGGRSHSSSRDWLLHRFVEDVLPEASDASVLLGTPGPAQKATIQLRDDSGRVIAYGKYAESDAGLRRLRRESAILDQLPEGAGPRKLKYGSVADGEMLVVAALSGRPLTADLPPLQEVADWCAAMTYGPQVEAGEHPWIVDLAGRAPGAIKLADDLSGTRWGLAIQHGDFAPWNLRLNGDSVSAFDWEYGRLDGFPFADLAYYYLQTAALVHDTSPTSALLQTADYLSGGPFRSSSPDRGPIAVARLALLDAYLQSHDDGHSDEEPLQSWRLAIVGDLL